MYVQIINTTYGIYCIQHIVYTVYIQLDIYKLHAQLYLIHINTYHWTMPVHTRPTVKDIIQTFLQFEHEQSLTHSTHFRRYTHSLSSEGLTGTHLCTLLWLLGALKLKFTRSHKQTDRQTDRQTDSFQWQQLCTLLCLWHSHVALNRAVVLNRMKLT